MDLDKMEAAIRACMAAADAFSDAGQEETAVMCDLIVDRAKADYADAGGRAFDDDD